MQQQSGSPAGRVLVVGGSVFDYLRALQGSFTVVAVRDARSALAFAPETFDVVLMDEADPARALAFKRRLDRRLTAVPVVFLSPHPDLPAFADAAEAFAHLTTPVDDAELLRVTTTAAQRFTGAPVRTTIADETAPLHLMGKYQPRPGRQHRGIV
jgi:CheY-like chemotaxis protein